jgi:hypothetical protein
MEVNMRKTIVSAGCLFVLILVAGVKADELTDLKQQVNQLQQKIDQLEVKQNQQSTQLAQDVNKAVEKKQVSALPDSMKWIENIKINGDFRYRFESINEEGKDDRIRNRIRARLGITGKVTDDITVGMRLATSEPFASDKGDPISTNQTLDDAFSEKPIWLDQAYFKWSPKDTGLNVFGGKMGNPFYRVGNNQLIFDDDLEPEGMAVQYTIPIGENDELFTNGGGFWVNEVSNGADTSLWGIQGGLKHKFADKSTLTGGVSYYSYGNIEGSGALIGSGFQGNSNSAGRYVSEYDTAEIFGEYGFTIGKTPTAAFASYVKNTSASTSQDTGWLVGGKLGKCKDPGSWELSYDYRDIEADAVLGAFNFSDFVGGGTNGKGHLIGYTYQLAKNTQGALTYFLDDKGDDNHRYDRLQADLVFKF